MMMPLYSNDDGDISAQMASMSDKFEVCNLTMAATIPFLLPKDQKELTRED